MHYEVWRLFTGPMFMPGVISWFMAQIFKMFYYYRIHRQWNRGWLLMAGGMPSAHSALIMATTVTAGLHEGFDSLIFGGLLAITLIVMHDAAGVRQEAGNQARAINKIVEHFFVDGEIDINRLKELIGHRPIEVLAGAGLGILVAVGYNLLRYGV
jgi:acid phosphatase family membrane protein YuiD